MVHGVSTATVSPSETIDRLYGSPAELSTQLLCVGSSGLAQIGFLQFALSGAPVAYTVPAYQSALLMLTLTLSGFVLQEYDDVPVAHVSIFGMSAALIVVGMLLNAWGLAHAARAAQGEDGAFGSEPASKKAPWEDDYPGVVDPEAADRARRAASAKYR